MSTTLGDLITEIGTVDTENIPRASVITRINDAVEQIAAGVRMPQSMGGMISPPLPDLFDTDTVSTSTTVAYVSLPSDYQRNVFMVADSDGEKVIPPRNGDYYSFALFMKQARLKDLSEDGTVDVVCVKGSNLYYQGIPSTSVDLTVHFYRSPTAMSASADVPDGIPGHLQKRLIKHYVLKEIFGETIEDGENSRGNAFQYHTGKFFEAMLDLIDFVGIDAEPEYFGSDDDEY